MLLVYFLLDFHNKVTTSETLISDYKVRSQVRNNVKSVEISDKAFHFLSLFQQIRIFTPYFAYNF